MAVCVLCQTEVPSTKRRRLHSPSSGHALKELKASITRSGYGSGILPADPSCRAASWTAERTTDSLYTVAMTLDNRQVEKVATISINNYIRYVKSHDFYAIIGSVEIPTEYMESVQKLPDPPLSFFSLFRIFRWSMCRGSGDETTSLVA